MKLGLLKKRNILTGFVISSPRRCVIARYEAILKQYVALENVLAPSIR